MISPENKNLPCLKGNIAFPWGKVAFAKQMTDEVFLRISPGKTAFPEETPLLGEMSA